MSATSYSEYLREVCLAKGVKSVLMGPTRYWPMSKIALSVLALCDFRPKWLPRDRRGELTFIQCKHDHHKAWYGTDEAVAALADAACSMRCNVAVRDKLLELHDPARPVQPELPKSSSGTTDPAQLMKLLTRAAEVEPTTTDMLYRSQRELNIVASTNQARANLLRSKLKDCEAILAQAEDSNDKLACRLKSCQLALLDAEKARDEAREYARQLHGSSKTVTCVYCGQAYPPGTPTSQHELLTEHIKVCERHPMRAMSVELGELRARNGRNETTLAVAIDEMRRLSQERDELKNKLDGAVVGLTSTRATLDDRGRELRDANARAQQLAEEKVALAIKVDGLTHDMNFWRSQAAVNDKFREMGQQLAYDKDVHMTSSAVASNWGISVSEFNRWVKRMGFIKNIRKLDSPVDGHALRAAYVGLPLGKTVVCKIETNHGTKPTALWVWNIAVLPEMKRLFEATRESAKISTEDINAKKKKRS